MLTREEFRVIREGLGISTGWLADHLDIARRTVERWEAGTSMVPDFAEEALEQLEAIAAVHVAEHVETFGAPVSGGLPPMIAIESETDTHVWPERWQRAIAFRVRQQVPGLRIVGVDESAPST